MADTYFGLEGEVWGEGVKIDWDLICLTVFLSLFMAIMALLIWCEHQEKLAKIKAGANVEEGK